MPENYGSCEPPFHSSRKTVLINVSADREAKIDKDMHHVLAATVCERERERRTGQTERLQLL